MSEPTTKGRGAFILFEGIDRSGKTTQVSKLVEHLQSSQVNAELWRFPDRTTALGQMINGYLSSSVELNDAAVHLVFAANRWEKSKGMLAALESGTTLVVDRYSYSGMAYTLSKQLPGIDAQWCKAPEVGLPAPDVVFYMRVSPEASAKRGGFGEERYEKAEFQKLVASNFDALKEENWVVLDADQSIEAIHEQIRQATDKLFSSGVTQQPIRKMYVPAAADRCEDGDVTVQLNRGAQHAKAPQGHAQQPTEEVASTQA